MSTEWTLFRVFRAASKASLPLRESTHPLEALWLRQRTWNNVHRVDIIPRLSRGEQSEPSAARKYASAGGTMAASADGHGIMSTKWTLFRVFRAASKASLPLRESTHPPEALWPRQRT